MANYISLKEAAKHCDYSQDYLKLRARQGKLKAIKIGRNWFTTKTWLNEYIKDMSAAKQIPVLTAKPKFPVFILILTAVLIILGWFVILNKNSVELIFEKIVPSKVIIIKSTAN